MAGKRQHYVPRLLQRGFLHDDREEAERTWLHRKGVAAELVGIKDVGVSDYFYSRLGVDGEKTLDDIITQIEGDLGVVIAGYRDSPDGAVVDASIAARTVVHLVTRTAHIRSVITQGFRLFFEEIEALFTDSERFAAVIGLDAPSPRESLLSVIRESARDLVPLGMPAAFSERLLAFLIREKGRGLLALAAAPIQEALGSFAADLKKKVRDAHAGMLAVDLAEHAWIETLSKFRWQVEARSGLILCDAVGLAMEASGKLVPLMFTDADKVQAVVLPVSSGRVLIGVRDSVDVPPLPDLNEQAAACSSTFFIATGPLDDTGLAELIGTRPASEIETAITEAVAGAGGVALHDEAVRTAEFTPTTGAFQFSLRLADFGDDNLVQQLGTVLESVVGALGRHLPLSDLDGFTLAADYAKALVELDRGEGLPPAQSTALAYGVGVAMPVRVVRNGIDRKHIVIEGGIAMSWMAEDDDLRATSLNILVTMLAGVAHDALYREQLGPLIDPDIMVRELHLAIATAPRGYFSTREAAFVAPQLGGVYAQLLLDSLAFARSEIEAARQRFAGDQDIAALVGKALSCVSAILAHAAEWLGHRDGLADDEMPAGGDLPDQLAGWDLSDWLDLYGRDLRSIYETVDGRLDLDRVMTMSRHVERMLWNFGILPWPEDDTIRWGAAPPGTLPTDR